MHKTAAWLARQALEELGIRYTFGIPGVHNTELYDELGASESITPVLVAHEGGGAFMADARQPHRRRRRHAADRPRRRRDPCRERHRRGLPRRHPDDRHRGRHPARPRPRLPAARHGPARPARAHHEGALAHRAPRRRDPGDPRGVPRGDERRARPGVRRDPGQPAADAGRCRRPARIRARRSRGISLQRGGHRARREVRCARRSTRAFSAAGAPWMLRAELIAIAELLGAPVTTTLQGLSCVSGQPPAARGLRARAGRRARGRECVSRLRLPARRRHALRRDPDRELRLGAAREPDPRGHQSARLRRELHGRASRSRAMRRAVLGLAARCARHIRRERTRRTPSRRRSRRTSAPTARNGSHTIRKAA